MGHKCIHCVPNEFSLYEDILFVGDYWETVSRVCCSRVTYYSMPARPSWSCATYKRFLHLASQVFTKYTARGLKFSQKERLVCARGFVEIFPPAAFLIPSTVSLCFAFSCPADKRGGAHRRVVSRPMKRAERRGTTRIAPTTCRLLLCYAKRPHEQWA